MKIRELKRATLLRRPIEEVFAFFAEAGNLELITPPWLKFEIVSPAPIRMRRGTTISYRIGLHGIPLRWQSEITEWRPPHLFVDEQRRGPYRFWRHEHRFIERADGTEVIDHVRYAVWADFLVHSLFVARDVQRIFDYREKKLRELFPATPNVIRGEFGRRRARSGR